MALENFLREQGKNVIHMDGDKTREGLCKDLGFTENDRRENLRRVAEVNKLFLDLGFIVINSFICPLEEYRQMVRDIVGRDKCVEVFINTPPDICEQRDVKGLYQKARSGEIKDFTGISSPFEIPAKPHLVIQNGEIPFDKASELLINFIIDYLNRD